MPEDLVILVDENDNAIGTEEKVKCHLPNGKLHRAFTALLFDKNGRLVLTKRAKGKMLWSGDWDGTFASHPRESETFVSSGERRMPEELGIEGKLDYLHKFEYHVPYKDIGSENEICGTLIGVIDESTELK
ncbi:MAG: NUDIX domain-containing protein, partial [Nitrosopumilus sp.]